MSDLTLLLGGAERKRARVRGFAEWSPNGVSGLIGHRMRGAREGKEDVTMRSTTLATIRISSSPAKEQPALPRQPHHHRRQQD